MMRLSFWGPGGPGEHAGFGLGKPGNTQLTDAPHKEPSRALVLIGPFSKHSKFPWVWPREMSIYSYSGAMQTGIDRVYRGAPTAPGSFTFREVFSGGLQCDRLQ
ncbi:MAG: hypothetical protein CM15mP103_06220 [Gammaproteobacteria bacterium]|nr:MAG: hypothetical protein CM15mP103_06220 [Gammaproteobacteria bacterium]